MIFDTTYENKPDCQNYCFFKADPGNPYIASFSVFQIAKKTVFRPQPPRKPLVNPLPKSRFPPCFSNNAPFSTFAENGLLEAWLKSGKRCYI